MASKIRFCLFFHGTIGNDCNWNLAMSHPATVDQPDRPARWVKIPVISVLFEHPDLGYVLWDTGPHPAVTGGAWLPPAERELFFLESNPDQTLEQQLRLVGISPRNINLLILSHLHWDHAGGLVYFQKTEAGEKIIVAEEEFKYALLKTHQKKNCFCQDGYCRHDFVLSDIQFDFWNHTGELARDFTLLALPGHTPCVLGVMVKVNSGDYYLFPGDALFTRANLEPEPHPPGLIYDSLAFYRSAELIKAWKRRYRAQLIYPHDSEQFKFLRLAPQWYE